MNRIISMNTNFVLSEYNLCLKISNIRLTVSNCGFSLSIIIFLNDTKRTLTSGFSLHTYFSEPPEKKIFLRMFEFTSRDK